MSLKKLIIALVAVEGTITMIRVGLLYWQVRSTPSVESINYFIVQSINLLLDYTHIEWIISYGGGGIIAFILYYALENYSEE